MLVLAAKSLPSSTKAFAGSQAAQQSVSDFPCACALFTDVAAIKPAAARPIRPVVLVMLVSSCALPALAAAPSHTRVALCLLKRLFINSASGNFYAALDRG